MSERRSLSLIEPITLSLSLNSLFSKEWHPMTTTSARWRRRRGPLWQGSACGTPMMTVATITPLTPPTRQRRSHWRRSQRRREGDGGGDREGGLLGGNVDEPTRHLFSDNGDTPSMSSEPPLTPESDWCSDEESSDNDDI
jgi:hypothetical protein